MTLTDQRSPAERLADAAVPGPVGRPLRPSLPHVPVLLRPASVEEPTDLLWRLGEAFDENSASIRAKTKAHTEALAKDIVEDADRFAEGNDAVAAEKRAAPTVAAELAELERERAVISVAGRTNAPKLHQAVVDAKAGWLVGLAAEKAKRLDAYLAAAAELARSAGAYQEVVGAEGWVAAVTDRELPMQTAKGRFETKIGHITYPVSDLVAGLRAAPETSKPREPQQASKGESRFTGVQA